MSSLKSFKNSFVPSLSLGTTLADGRDIEDLVNYSTRINMWHATACDALNNTGVNIEIEMKREGEKRERVSKREWVRERERGRRSECATSTAAGQLVTLKTSTQVAIAFLCPCPCPCPCILRCPFFFPAFSRFPYRVVDDNDDDPISIWNRTPHPAPADAVTIVVCHGELPHIPCSCTISSITLLPLSLPPPPQSCSSSYSSRPALLTSHKFLRCRLSVA